MATTKKVAVSSPVKSKKSVSSTPKKVTKKSVSKKVIKTKTVDTKVGSIAISNNTAAKTSTRKTSGVEEKLKKRSALKNGAKTQLVTKVRAAKPAFALALLSPYRFPVDVEKIAVGTARFGGVFFVIVGAFFTLLFANSALPSQTQLASLTTGETLSTVDQSSGSGSGTNTANVDTKPKAEFIVNNPENLSGSVQVKVKVPYATGVTLMAYYKTQGQEITIGRPQKVSDDAWEMYVDTTKYDDGEYKLKALITNSYGSYEEVDDAYVVITNHTTVAGTQSATTVASGDTDTTSGSDETVEASAHAALSVNTKESASEFRFEVTVDDADKVRIYAKDASGTRKLIGYAYESDSDTWKYKWLLDSVATGVYEIEAKVEIDGDYITSNSVSVRVVTASTTTTVEQTTPVETATTSTTVENKVAPLAPEIKVSFDANAPFSGIVTLKIEVRDAQSVEVYALPKNALVQRYLGPARKADDKVWLYRWDTNTTPNGEYKLVAYVRNAYGTYLKETTVYGVQNTIQVTRTEEEQQTVEKLVAVVQEEEKVAPQMVEQPATPAEIENDQSSEEQQTSLQEDGDDLQEVIDAYKDEIEDELQKLASALRVGDENAIFEIKERLNRLKEDIKKSHLQSSTEDRLLSQIDEYLAQTIRKVEEDVVRIEKVVAERTALEASKDSDQDGISDFDEIAIYGTDPFGADTDGDGFIDGAEILKGYNPTDPSSEVLVAYESPKETGIVREDILVVESITTASPNEESDAPAAIIAGKALPNSFVTLYIFSTPVVVTLKTDKDGNWNYRFEKELEDGEHEVYVGVTDNAGKIVAKSNAFSFVKEAQAFSAVNNTTPVPQSETPSGSFISQYMVYLVLSISVVAIGLVLILLGLHLDSRQRKFGDKLGETQAAV